MHLLAQVQVHFDWFNLPSQHCHILFFYMCFDSKLFGDTCYKLFDINHSKLNFCFREGQEKFEKCHQSVYGGNSGVKSQGPGPVPRGIKCFESTEISIPLPSVFSYSSCYDVYFLNVLVTLAKILLSEQLGQQ